MGFLQLCACGVCGKTKWNEEHWRLIIPPGPAHPEIVIKEFIALASGPHYVACSKDCAMVTIGALLQKMRDEELQLKNEGEIYGKRTI